jgi:hypothetical protein
MGEVIIAIFIGACMSIVGLILRIALAKEKKKNAEGMQD